MRKFAPAVVDMLLKADPDEYAIKQRDKEGKVFFDTVYKKQKKRIFNALKNSEPESVVKFKEVLNRIING